MIETKPKKCKGIGKAISVKGCGIMTLWRRYGLCPDCLGEFLFGTDAGKIIMHNSILPKAKAIVKRNDKATVKELRKSLKTRSEYENDLQTQINAIVKYIDKGHPCIATNKMEGKRNAGHYFGRLSHPPLRYHLENIWNQSEYSNNYKSGDVINYQNGLVSLYGKEYLDGLNSLKMIKPLKLSIDELKEFTKKARAIVNELKQDETIYTTEQRLYLRKLYNEQLGIYNESSAPSPNSKN